MRCLFFVLALAFAQLQAEQIVLDEVMSRDEQKKAGLTKLSLQEKVELEAWLNRTCVLKEPKKEAEAQLFLSININQGQKLQLSDNSIWEIAPSDIQTSSVWITPFPVKITPSNDPNYPSLITNVNSGVSVRARKLPSTNQPTR